MILALTALCLLKVFSGDVPGGPVDKTVLPMHGAQILSLVKESDPTCWQLRSGATKLIYSFKKGIQ